MYYIGLTTRVSHWAAHSPLVNGCASLHVQGALLHYACCHIPDTVAEFARFVRLGWDLGAICVKPAINRAPVVVMVTNFGRSHCANGCGIHKINWNCKKTKLFQTEDFEQTVVFKKRIYWKLLLLDNFFFGQKEYMYVVMIIPSGQVMMGQHWSPLFSTIQSCPMGFVKGHTLR